MKIWGTGILNGFRLTMVNWARGPMTVQYPEQRLTLPERARWTVHQKYDEEGLAKCTACLICERECPDHIIRIEMSKLEDGSKHIDEYVYEVGACMMCGLCVAACPFDAIYMSHEFELATADSADLSRVLLRDVPAYSRKSAKEETDA